MREAKPSIHVGGISPAVSGFLAGACITLLLLAGGWPKEATAQKPQTPPKEAKDTVPAGLRGRTDKMKQKLLDQEGGTKESEAAVALGLQWLAKHQFKDGHWSLEAFEKAGRCTCSGHGEKNDTAATAFGLLPFLGAGYVHRATTENSNTHYASLLQQGFAFLLRLQREDGYFGNGMYAHALATIAVCEAYALTHDSRLKHPAQKALDLIAHTQGPSGGWRYEPQPAAGDTLQTSWQLQALKVGEITDFKVPQRTFQNVDDYLDSVQAKDGIGYGYTKPDDVSPTMTAAGVLCRQFVGWRQTDAKLIKAVKEVAKTAPGSLNDMYHDYHATQVMFHMGGDYWKEWNPKMRDYLIKAQDQGDLAGFEHQKGSWTPGQDKYGKKEGGRIMMTSMALLTLEIYYRHLPLFERSQK
jgi:hypothetical protein